MLRLRITVSLPLILSVFLGVFFLFFLTTPAFATAGIYRTINFQGKVVNKTSGTNITNGSYSFTFKLYDDPTAGNQLPTGTPWSETQSLTVTDSIFRATLGSTTPIPAGLDFNSDLLYLDITFNGETFGSRVRMTAVPYAFNSEKVNGLTVTNTTGTLTIPSATTVTFSGANNLTFTTSALTSATLPSGTITLADTTSNQTFTNKIIGSTGLTFTGASTDIITGTNEDFIISPNGTGKVGIGNGSPTAMLDVTGTTSISGVLTVGDGVTNTIQSPYGPLTLNYKSNQNAWTAGLTLQDSTGYLGLGTATPTYPLSVVATAPDIANGRVVDIDGTLTSTTNDQQGLKVSPVVSPGGATARTYSGLQLSLSGNSVTRLTNAVLRGVEGYVSFSGASGTMGTAVGGRFKINNTSTGTITNAYGNIIASPANGGVLTNTWGLYLESQSVGTQSNAPYAIYQAGTTDQNYFGGNTGIGVLVPTTRLDVSQTAAAGTAEEIAHFAISDDATAYMSIRNGSTTDSLFSPQLRFKGSGANTAGNIQGMITTDTGTQPAWVFTSQLASSAIVTRPLMAIRNYTTDVMNILANGNVGINNQAPAEKLDVGGSATVSGNITMGGQAQLGRFSTEPVQVGVGSMYYNVTTNKFRCYQNAAWTDCIGAGGTPSWDTITAPGANLALAMGAYTSTFTYNATTSTNNLFNLTDTTGNTGTGYMMNLTTQSSSTLKPFHVAAAGIEAILVNASGNVGIGTLSPVAGAKLDVNGNMNVTGYATASASLSVGSYGALGGVGNGVFSGYIGIGTATPTHKLDVSSLSSFADLANFDWSPAAVTTSTSDLFSLNIGANGTIGNIFNVKDNGGSVFGISQSAITANLPTNFTAVGDVGMAYDLNFYNSTSSYIKSVAPLYMVAGEEFNSSDLTLRTYNYGNVIVDSHLYVTNPSVTGRALATFNQTENQDIFTASASGVAKFTVDRLGDATAAGNITMGGQMQLGRLGSEPTTLGIGSMYYNATTNKFRCYQNAAWTDCIGAGGTPSWDTITLPAGNLALTMNSYTSTFTYGATTSTNNLFNLTDTSGNTGTGYMLNLATASTSTLKPFHVSSAGVEAILVNASGNVGIGNLTPVGKLDVSGAVTGKALAIFNETGDQALFTASASGITKFNVDHSGNVTIAGYATAGASLSVGSYSALAGIGNAVFSGFVGIGTATPTHKLDVSSLSSTADLANFDWSPAAATTSTLDLFALNIGINGTIGNIFNVKDNGGSVFGISQSAITANIPANFTSAGDVGIAYDLSFSNPISSYIKSSAPLYLVSGEAFNSSDLTLRTYNNGNVNVDSHLYVSGSYGTGRAIGIFNQLENQDIFTASASGISQFTIDRLGDATASGNITMGGQMQLGRLGSEPTTLGIGSMYYNATTNKFRCYQNVAWTDCIGAGGTPSWDSVAAPGGNLALTMGTYTSTFTYNAATSTNNLFNLTDTNSNTGTGYMMNLTTGTSSTLNPFHVAAAGTEAILVNASGNVGIGNLTPNAKLDVAGSASISGTLTIGNGTTNAIQSPYGPLSFYYKSGLNSWSTGMVIDDITGNVGIGNSTATTQPLEALHVGGNILIDAKPNTSALDETTWTAISNSAGNVSGGTGSIASVSAMVTYNGSLYVGTEKANGAEVYRYNGPTLNTWTVLNSTPGTFLTTANIDRVSSMVVFNGKLYIGTFESNSAEVYRYDGSTTWTKVTPAAAGTILTTTLIDGIGSMVVYNSKLYAGTIEAGKAEIYRYDPGTGVTTWVKVSNATAGTIITTTLMDAIHAMVVYNGALWAGGSKPNAAEIYRYTGGTTWTRAGTAGTLVTAARDYITSMVVFNGNLYIGVMEPGGGADVIRLDDTGTTSGWAANFVRVNSASGTIIPGGTSAIVGIKSMTEYNGRLYIGTNKAGAAEVYRFDGQRFTKVSQQTAGQVALGGTSAIDEISSMIQYGNDLIIGTKEAAAAEIYKNTVVLDESYALIFHGSNSNLAEQNGLQNTAEIMFSASASAAMGTGSFVFSNGIKTNFGAYDVAEDYPTRDQLVQPGDIVSLDIEEAGMVNRSTLPYDSKMVGVYSENPGLRLSQKDSTLNGGKPIPIALVGRVPVRVSTENGIIEPGDSLTSSSVPGVAMKATKAGMVLGRAMEGYNGEGTGKILTFVNMSSFNGVAQKTYDITTALEEGSAATDSAALLSEVVTDRVSAGTIFADRISAKHIDGLDEMKETIDLLSVKVASLEAGITYPTGSESAGLFGFDQLGSNIMTSPIGLTLLGKTTAYEMNIVDKLTLGLLTIESDASASGSIQTAVVPLQLQKDSLGNLEIMGSKIIIDTSGNMVVKGSIMTHELATNRLTILDEKDATSGAVLATSAGKSEIAVGQTAILVKTSALTDKSLIFTTPENIPTGVAAKRIDANTIQISIASPLREVLKVNWWIIN